MKILHYFLGFPPYRTGGMTKFVYDLMNSQMDDGNEVIALWPGRMNFVFDNNVKIKKRKSINNISNYEIINPLPVSLDEGIKDVKEFTKECDYKIYYEFLNKIRPDVIHIHTLMGLHKEFIKAANLAGIKTIFTTHDYFGICPKVVLYKYGNVCDNDCDCKECIRCNYSALSLKKIKIMQSSIYRNLKDKKIVKCLRKKHRNNFFEEVKPDFIENEDKLEIRKKQYQTLRKYYVDILENIDVIHFNSNLTKGIYLKYIKPKKYKVISISHKNIKDNRNNKHVDSDKIRFTFLASTKPYKGFYLLKEVLDELYKKTFYGFELNVYGNISEKSEYMNVYENGFNQNDLPDIFSKTDILVAPSIWYETFGFTVLEALSYGVPVIISDNVGAKDIVFNGGIIIESNNIKKMQSVIERITMNKIKRLKNNVKNIKIKKWSSFCNEIKELYNEDTIK